MTKTTKKKKTTKKLAKKIKTSGKKNFDSFSEKSLKKYIGIFKKLRKKKNNKKKKKIGLTNITSFINLLHNADMERKKQTRRSRMMAHPYSYPYLIKDADVNKMWGATKIKSGRTKKTMVDNMNSIYSQILGFELLKPSLPAKKLPKHKRGSISIKAPDDVAITTTKQTQHITQPVALPSKPSRAPPMKYDSDSSESSSESSYDSDGNKKRKRK